MTQSNRIQVAFVRETTPGTTPTTPRMRIARITDASLSALRTYVDSDELRSDRMLGDPIAVMREGGGQIPYELSYPTDETWLSEVYRSAFYNAWQNTPQRFNDGTADSVITGVATTGEVVTVTTGAAFVASHLVWFTGFGVAGNNGVFKATTGSATVPAFIGAGLTDEAAPPAAARIKVVGFQGASGDITALADGLGSTSLNFTTLGISVGQWVKIGGTATASQFAFLVTAGAAARRQAWARVTAITSTKLTLDNLPAGWTTDSGTSKTIKVWFGDTIKNGVTQSAMSMERGYLGQTTPTYLVNAGMVAMQLSQATQSRQKVTGQITFMGMDFSKSTTALDASPDAATTSQVMAANANVGRVSDGGSQVVAPNWCQSLSWQINSNGRAVEDVQFDAPQALHEGEFLATVTVEKYFGSSDVLDAFYNGTPTSVSQRVQKNGQAIIYQWPRITYRGGGDPQNQSKNNDVRLSLQGQSSYDTLTGAHMLCDRVEYYED